MSPADGRSGELAALAPMRIAGLLSASAATVVAELVALGGEGGWRPEPGEWSANECVGHLIEAERRGSPADRRIVADADPAGRCRSRAGLRRPSPMRGAITCARLRAAAEFDALRLEGIELVRGLRPADLELAGLHPEVGLLRVDELLGEWVHHDRNHIRQMLAVTQARVWPQMGNARRFSLEDL